MKTESICPRCGAPVDEDSFCPRCEFAVALEPPSPAVPASEPSPKRFGDYELLEELGHGGMGVVYKARHIKLDRVVALKLLLLGQFSSEQAVERFQREGRAAAALRHPNIVGLHELGECEGQYYLTMELVEGRSLASLLRDGPLTSAQAASHCGAIALAVNAAHSAGIIHRDLKPANILIDRLDQPRITDFGLAKRLDGSGDITLTGHVLGSPNYLAPELVDGREKECGPCTDIFSIGAILYECLTGRPPFLSTTLQETLLRIRDSEPVAPRMLNSKLPRDLETICLKCLEKEPARRYVSAELLAADLARFLRDEPIHARPAGRAERAWRWCRRKPALAGSLAAATVLFLAVLIGSPIAVWRIDHERQRAEKGESDARANELKARQIAYASDMNLAHQAVKEDDFYRAHQLLDRHRPQAEKTEDRGRTTENKRQRTGTGEQKPDRLLSSDFRLPTSDLRGWEWRYLWKQCQGEERFILGEHTGGATAVGMLADGKTVFSAGRDKCVRLWDLESRRQIGLLQHEEAVIGAAASPDGRWLATASSKYAEAQPVLLWDLATHKPTTLTTDFWLCPESITFSPDSRWLAFGTVLGGLRLWDVNARSEVKNLPASIGSTRRRGVAFSPDGHTLAYNENEYGAILLWDLASRSVSRLTGHRSAVAALAFSPDSQTLASGSHDRTARLWHLAGRLKGLEFNNTSGGITSLAFSSDGHGRTLLAMSAEGGAGRVIRLVEVATGGRKAERRGHLKDISGLGFTPDGQTLLSASEDGTIRVWDAVPVAREDSTQLFAPNSISTDLGSYGDALFLSPDGRHLLTAYTDQTFSVWDTLNLVEGERRRLPISNTTITALAPGGRLAVFGSRNGEMMLWDEGRVQAQPFVPPGLNHIHRLVFSADGRHLAAADNASTLALKAVTNDPGRTVRVWDVGARKETHVLSTDGEYPWSLTFSADARVLMAGCWKGQVKLWSLDGQGGAATLRGPSEGVEGLALLPDGQTLISAAASLRFWDVQTRRENAPNLSPRAGGFSGLALSRDGRRLATGASDGRITIWDVDSHQEVATLRGHEESVRQLAFTPDGDHLVSVSKDQLRVWHAASWAEADAEREARK